MNDRIKFGKAWNVIEEGRRKMSTFIPKRKLKIRDESNAADM